MRFLIAAAPDPKKPPSNAPPSEQLIRDLMKFNEEMHVAGVLVASEGLNPVHKAVTVGNVNGQRTIIDGPFAETKELVGGFYLIDVKSREEAIAWALKSPVGAGFDDLLTIHQLTEASDIPPEMVKLIDESAPKWAATFRR